QSDVGSVVFLDQGQRQIDSSSYAGRRIEMAVLNEERIRIDAQFGKALGNLAGEAPVCGYPPAIQQPGGRERINAGAHRSHAPDIARASLEPVRNARIGSRLQPQPFSSRNNDRIKRWGGFEGAMWADGYSRLSNEDTAAQSQHQDFVRWRRVRPRGGKLR